MIATGLDLRVYLKATMDTCTGREHANETFYDQRLNMCTTPHSHFSQVDMADTDEGGDGCKVTVTWEASGAKPEHGRPDVSVPFSVSCVFGQGCEYGMILLDFDD